MAVNSERAKAALVQMAVMAPWTTVWMLTK